MAETKAGNGCPRCAELEARVAALEAQLAALQAQLANARKNSGNSSKPPSGDIVAPPKAGQPRGKKRKIGGQPGHPRHQRPPVPPDQLDQHWVMAFQECPCCSGPLSDATQSPRVRQRIELPAVTVQIEQYDSQPQWCARCQRTFIPQFPEDLRKAGLVGARLTALIGYLKGPCHLSFSSIRKYLRDVVGVTLSRSMLRNLVRKVSDSLEDPYEALLAMLPRENRLNVDETGHKENGKRLWTWCFRAYLYTVYKISPSRGSDVLIEVLGNEFDGLLGCDYFSAYRKYMRLNDNVLVQFCLAHFIRDVKFLAEHPDRKNQAYGQRLLEDLRRLFGVIHRRQSYASPQTFQRALENARNDLVGDTILESPGTHQAINLEDRFYKHIDSYFRFISEPSLEPTNNLAEQAIRFVAIHRRITQGTRSEDGRRWCERMWTVVQTCAQQGRSVFEFFYEAVKAHFGAKPAPSLVPDSS